MVERAVELNESTAVMTRPAGLLSLGNSFGAVPPSQGPGQPPLLGREAGGGREAQPSADVGKIPQRTTREFTTGGPQDPWGNNEGVDDAGGGLSWKDQQTMLRCHKALWSESHTPNTVTSDYGELTVTNAVNTVRCDSALL